MARIQIAVLIIALLSPALVGAADLEGSLLAAARSGSRDAVKALAVRGADLEARDERGASALHLAAAYGHTDVVEALLAAGADANAVGPIGNTALHYVAQEGHAEIAGLLVAAGARTSVRSEYGTTPRSLAEGWGHRDVIAALTPIAEPASGPGAGHWVLAGLAGILALAGLPFLGLSAAQLLAETPRAHVVR